VILDEVDDVELAALHLRDVADDRLEPLSLQRGSQQVHRVGAGVEHGDDGLSRTAFGV
jgi:hypothetical protein